MRCKSVGRIGGVVALMVGLCVALALRARADHLILNDGTVIEGTVLSQGEKYWVKKGDGTSQLIPKTDVKTYGKGPAPAVTTPGAAGTGTAKPAGVAGSTGTASTPTPVPSAGGTGDFAATKTKADKVEVPMAAVTIWQKFLDTKPSAADAAAAKTEMDKWQKMSDDGAEKINGKWLQGEALKDFHKKVQEKLKTAAEQMHGQQTLQALKTLEEVRRMYPNSFEANFLTGYLNLLERKDKDAISYLEQAVKLRPDEPAANSNLGVALFATRTDLQRGIVLMHRAVELQDSQDTAHNLIMSLSMCPNEMKYNPKIQPAIASARLLASKYGLQLGGDYHGDHWMLIPYSPRGGKGEFTGDDEDFGAKPGVKVASGTGFIINDDGLILTNRHVVEGASSYLVMLDGKVKKAGEIVVIDTDQDLALLRIKPDAKLPVTEFTDTDAVHEGAACYAMGFPLIDRMGASIKVTQGIVSGSGRGDVGADVVIDAKVNPGNSGGPLLDKYGRVIGIITMKTRAATFEDSYGLAIGSSKILEFLEKNKVTVKRGAPGSAALTAEDVVAKVKPATVCIIATHDK